jgi:hypothetical protein
MEAQIHREIRRLTYQMKIGPNIQVDIGTEEEKILEKPQKVLYFTILPRRPLTYDRDQI